MTATTLTTRATTVLADHNGHWHGPGWWAPLFFLGWVLIIWLVVGFIARRFWWGRCGGPGYYRGPWGQAGPGGPSGPGGHERHGASAESVLAERYAKGEVDEEEFRQRRAVLREGEKQ